MGNSDISLPNYVNSYYESKAFKTYNVSKLAFMVFISGLSKKSNP